MIPRLPDHEAERLADLYRHRLLDTPPEQEFDDLVRLTAQVCSAPIAAISLVDEHRQWFKAIRGLPLAEMPRDTSFCAHTILQTDLFVVEDAENDPCFADKPLVMGDPNIRFYAGMPLITEEGYALGSLCVIDRIPRTLTSEEEQTLRLLARQAISHLKTASRLAQMRHLVAEKERLARERKRAEAERQTAEAERLRLAAIVESSADAIVGTDMEDVITSWNMGAEHLYGYAAEEMIGRPQAMLIPPDEVRVHADLFPIVVARGRLEGLEVVHQRKDGARICVSTTLSVIYNDVGHIVGVSSVGRDITARKQAEAALEAEREFTRALLESLQEGIVACDAQGTLTLFNRATREFHGLPEQPLPPERWAEHFDLFQADGLTPMRTQDIPLFRAFEGEMVRGMEMVIAPKSGTPRTLLASGQAIYGPDGRKLGAVVAMHDMTERKRQDEVLARSLTTLQESQALLAEAQRVAKMGSWEYDIVSGKIVWSTELLGLVGLKQERETPDYASSFALYHPQDAAALAALASRAVEFGEGYEIDLRLADMGGPTQWRHAVGRAVRDGSGQVVRLVGTLSDVTERKKAEDLLAESQQRLALATKSAQIGIWDWGVATDTLLWDAQMYALYGIHEQDFRGTYEAWQDYLLPEDRQKTQSELARVMAGGRDFHTEFRVVWRSGETRHIEAHAAVQRGSDGAILRMTGVNWDVTERKRAEEKIREHGAVLEFQKRELERANTELAALATTDGLTGLKNHRAFQERLAEEINRSRRYGSALSVILLDVDYFKQYNDTFGHPAGDEVLKQVASMLRQKTRETDLTARYGGEEFALLLPQADLECATVFAERLRLVMAGHTWPLRTVTASFGVASLDTAQDTGTELIARVDAAMYRSKMQGRNRVTRASDLPIIPEDVSPSHPVLGSDAL